MADYSVKGFTDKELGELEGKGIPIHRLSWFLDALRNYFKMEPAPRPMNLDEDDEIEGP